MDKRFTESFSKICGTSTYCTCGCGSHSSTKREVVSVKHYKSQFFKETFSDPNNIFQLNCFLPTSQNLGNYWAKLKIFVKIIRIFFLQIFKLQNVVFLVDQCSSSSQSGFNGIVRAFANKAQIQRQRQKIAKKVPKWVRFEQQFNYCKWQSTIGLRTKPSNH